MDESESFVIDGIVVEDSLFFTLADLCRACGAERSQVLALVDEGVLQPVGNGPQDWRFGGPSLRTARTATRLLRDLELGIAGVALVIELLAEVEALRAQLRQAGSAR